LNIIGSYAPAAYGGRRLLKLYLVARQNIVGDNKFPANVFIHKLMVRGGRTAPKQNTIGMIKYDDSQSYRKMDFCFPMFFTLARSEKASFSSIAPWWWGDYPRFMSPFGGLG